MKKAFTLVAGLALCGALAMAGTVTMTFTGTGSNSYGGDITYPYYVSVNGETPLLMMCDDAGTHISVGEKWTAHVYTLTDLANLKFSNAGLQTYEEAAVIFTGVANGTIDAALGNAAVWSLFDSSFLGSNSPNLSAINQIKTTAGTEVAAGGLDYSHFAIYTPTPMGASQEFLSGYVASSSAVPEPASYALLGAGLLSLGLLRRRRSNRA